jgi:hypothetical protein
MLDDYPLFLVGADYNQGSQSDSANLIKADIWAKVIWGHSRPDLLSDDLTGNYGSI